MKMTRQGCDADDETFHASTRACPTSMPSGTPDKDEAPVVPDTMQFLLKRAAVVPWDGRWFIVLLVRGRRRRVFILPSQGLPS